MYVCLGLARNQLQSQTVIWAEGLLYSWSANLPSNRYSCQQDLYSFNIISMYVRFPHVAKNKRSSKIN